MGEKQMKVFKIALSLGVLFGALVNAHADDIKALRTIKVK